MCVHLLVLGMLQPVRSTATWEMIGHALKYYRTQASQKVWSVTITFSKGL